MTPSVVYAIKLSRPFRCVSMAYWPHFLLDFLLIFFYSDISTLKLCHFQMNTATKMSLVPNQSSFQTERGTHWFFLVFLTESSFIHTILLVKVLNLSIASLFLYLEKWPIIFRILSFPNGLSYSSEIGSKWKIFQSRFRNPYSFCCYTIMNLGY